MQDTELRTAVKLLKATGHIKNYYEIAELLQITEKGFYNWLNEYYNFSYEKKTKLKEIIKILC